MTFILLGLSEAYWLAYPLFVLSVSGSARDGVAAAFNITRFAHYGDSFSKEQYASILVLMETGLMVGRITNLAPTLAFVPSADFSSYFRFSAIVLALLIPLYLFSKRK